METSKKESLDLKDIEEYKIVVENLAIKKDPLIFPNESSIHASIVMGNFLKYSEDTVRIFDGNLTGDIADIPYTGFKENLEKFASTNKKLILVISSTEKDKSSYIYSKLREYSKLYPDRFIIKQSLSNSKSSNLKNYTIGDNCAFRIEFSDNAPSDKNVSRKAFCSFNQPAIVSSLLSSFNTSLSESKEFFSE